MLVVFSIVRLRRTAIGRRQVPRASSTPGDEYGKRRYRHEVEEVDSRFQTRASADALAADQAHGATRTLSSGGGS
jgi:hypothetical protein